MQIPIATAINVVNLQDFLKMQTRSVSQTLVLSQMSFLLLYSKDADTVCISTTKPRECDQFEASPWIDIIDTALKDSKLIRNLGVSLIVSIKLVYIAIISSVDAR